jgi:catechol 2,3-dioxygenase-like lactoylglutathione lyase family enzyme
VDQRVSLITLGVADLGRAREFYCALGWQTRAEPGDDVVFFQAGGMIVGLWDRGRLAEDSGVEDSGGWGGITLAQNVATPGEVDATIDGAVPPGRASSASPPKRSGAGTRPSSATPTATRGRSRTTRTGRSPPTARSASAAEAFCSRFGPDSLSRSSAGAAAPARRRSGA